MIIEYDKSPNVSPEQKIQSLVDSVMRGFEEIETNGGGSCEAISSKAIDDICTPIGNGSSEALPIASKTRLGCMIVGEGLNVRADGTVWSDGTVMDAMTNAEIEAICK